MLLNFIGKGSAFNTKIGNTSAYIKKSNNLILIDCGESIFERRYKKKFMLIEVAGK